MRQLVWSCASCHALDFPEGVGDDFILAALQHMQMHCIPSMKPTPAEVLAFDLAKHKCESLWPEASTAATSRTLVSWGSGCPGNFYICFLTGKTCTSDHRSAVAHSDAALTQTPPNVSSGISISFEKQAQSFRKDALAYASGFEREPLFVWAATIICVKRRGVASK